MFYCKPREKILIFLWEFHSRTSFTEKWTLHDGAAVLKSFTVFTQSQFKYLGVMSLTLSNPVTQTEFRLVHIQIFIFLSSTCLIAVGCVFIINHSECVWFACAESQYCYCFWSQDSCPYRCIAGPAVWPTLRFWSAQWGSWWTEPILWETSTVTHLMTVCETGEPFISPSVLKEHV